MNRLLMIVAGSLVVLIASCRQNQEENLHETVVSKNDCREEQKKADSIKALYDSIQLNFKETAARLQLEKSGMQLITNMYKDIFSDKNLSALDKYIGQEYIQHNPNLGDGKEALLAALKYKFDVSPDDKVEIQHMAANNDIVFVHSRLTSGNKTASVIDIYRIKNNKVTEHWDVMQEVPRRSVSSHPMF